MARRGTAPESPLFGAPAHEPIQCPRCGRLYEAPFEVDGVKVRGHVQGGPNCPGPALPLPGELRDGRARRAPGRRR